MPPIVLFLSTTKLITKEDIDSVKFVMSGAAPLSGNDVERFYEKFDSEKKKIVFSQGMNLLIK